MTIGIVGTSMLENERRVPVVPEHLPRFPEPLRRRMVFERGYGRAFGFDDAFFADHGAELAPREDLLRRCGLVVLPKPVPGDLEAMQSGQVLFGWTHCVQQGAIAQPAIDRRLTLIAWESMHHWSAGQERLVHVFYRNNEIAGYAAVLHCLQLLGIDGHYGPRRTVVVLSYGSVSRGAIYALQGRGFNNIRVFTRRPPHMVAGQNPDCYYGQYWADEAGRLWARDSAGCERPLIDELAEADMLCNGILQDPMAPVLFVTEADRLRLKPRSLIIDISCDQGMGFCFATPTSFASPTIDVGAGITYYAVDHAPSYLWHAASREISRAMIEFLPLVAGGPAAWDATATLSRAIEIRDGVVRNPQLLAFQRRSAAYPHLPLDD
jgi:alanine dehydrogenase